MAKRITPSSHVATASPPTIYAAALGADGSVMKGAQLTQAAAEAHRQSGQDVVVCGPTLRENRRLAQLIELNANKCVKRCPPHANAGPQALPHYQPDPRPPRGHTFYETDNRKAS